MVAVAVMATGLSVVMSGLVAQHQGRSGVRDTQRAAEMLAALRERLLSEPWTQTLTTPVRGLGVASWCTPGTYDPSSPLTGAGAHTEAELIATGIILQPTGLTDLRYFVEYYRAETLGPSQLGLLDTGSDADSDHIYDPFANEAAALAGLQANVSLATRFTTTPTAGISSGEILAIRLVVVWRGMATFGSAIEGTAGAFRTHTIILARGAN